jgi:dipeptidyl-peptidase-3
LQINDYQRLRTLVGELLAIVQDIKSRGDYEAAKNLVETYGVKINPELHREVKGRFAQLNISPYGGFVNPEFIVIQDGDKIKDIQIDYQFDYEKQMMDYAKRYSFLK